MQVRNRRDFKSYSTPSSLFWEQIGSASEIASRDYKISLQNLANFFSLVGCLMNPLTIEKQIHLHGIFISCLSSCWSCCRKSPFIQFPAFPIKIQPPRQSINQREWQCQQLHKPFDQHSATRRKHHPNSDWSRHCHPILPLNFVNLPLARAQIAKLCNAIQSRKWKKIRKYLFVFGAQRESRVTNWKNFSE